MHTPSTPARADAWRTPLEIGFWVLVTLANGLANSMTQLMDARRGDPGFEAWQPAVWELTSGLAWLAIIPCLAWFTRRFPLHWGGWKHLLPLHLAASIVVSLAHVLGMVLLRELAYAIQGLEYDVGPLTRTLPYEYLKDVRTYAAIVATIELYRFVLRRRQGEASLLGAPDEGEPIEPVERPSRFLVRKLNREFLVAAEDIEWLQASGNYVNLRVRGHDYPLRSTIGGIEAKLDPARFARIHRSFIVNLGLVASIEPLDTGDARLHLADGTVLPCSRRHRDALRASIGA